MLESSSNPNEHGITEPNRDPLSNNANNESEADTKSEEKSDFSEAFSASFLLELDAIGYPTGGNRSASLAKDFKIGKAQSYRIMNGNSFPSVESLATLRKMGCSIDQILDRAIDLKSQSISIEIDSKSRAAIIQRSVKADEASVLAVPGSYGQYVLRSIEPGSVVPNDAIPVHSIQFPNFKSLAIVDDDENTLHMLGVQMSKAFRVFDYSTGNALLALNEGLKLIDAFIVDWRLPDIDGNSLVKAIRQHTLAPIFILTGYESSSAEIAKAIEFKNMFHVIKPAVDVILIQLIKQSLKHS
jgi:CheY-like chemotaxis protein